MDWGFSTIKDIAEFVSFVVTSLSLSAIYFSYFHSKKQIHFTTIEKCINDYRSLYHKYEEKYNNPKFLDQYLDLVNEELFYIENGYLPKEVAEEWIDGMIDYLPFIMKGNFISSLKFVQFDNQLNTEKQLFSFPRILKFITISIDFDFEKIYLPLSTRENLEYRNKERMRLIKHLRKNLKKK